MPEFFISGGKEFKINCMKHIIIRKTSLFPADKNMIFNCLTHLDTLRYIASPYASFEPLNCGENLIWEEGGSFDFSFRLFSFIPLGRHRINVIDFDSERGIYTEESNPYVPIWNHRIYLADGVDGTEYTDEVEIYAGWKTFFVALWAKMFYAHRQRKWIKLLMTADRKDL